MAKLAEPSAPAAVVLASADIPAQTLPATVEQAPQSSRLLPSALLTEVPSREPGSAGPAIPDALALAVVAGARPRTPESLELYSVDASRDELARALLSTASGSDPFWESVASEASAAEPEGLYVQNPPFPVPVE